MNSIKETSERLRFLMDNIKDVVFPQYSAERAYFAGYCGPIRRGPSCR